MKRDLVYSLVTILAVAGICFGLARMRPEFAPTKSEPFHLDEKAASPTAKAADGGKIVMRVNGEPVTDRQFQLFVSGMPENMQQMASSPAGRRIMAEQISSLIALAQEGRKMGLDRDPALRMQLDAEQTNALAMAALRKMVSSDDKRLRAAYEKQKGNFEGIELKHIVVAYQGGKMPARPGTQALPPDVAMQKAAMIEMQLRRGADFAVMARAQSDDTETGQRGGVIGPVGRQSMPPDMANVIFNLKNGEISKPVRTDLGIHIFKAGERKWPTFEQLKPQLEAELQQEIAKETLDRIKKQSDVNLDPAFFGPEPPKADPKNPSQLLH